MQNDPIVEEARKAGQAYIDSMNGDLKAVVADLRRRAEQSGQAVISSPPKRPPSQPATTKRAG